MFLFQIPAFFWRCVQIFYAKCQITFTIRSISGTSFDSAFRNLYSIFFFYSFFFSLEVLCMWSERLVASSFASEGLFTPNQPLSERVFRFKHIKKEPPRLGRRRAVNCLVFVYIESLYRARAKTRLVSFHKSHISVESATPSVLMFAQSVEEGYSRDRCFHSPSDGGHVFICIQVCQSGWRFAV